MPRADEETGPDPIEGEVSQPVSTDHIVCSPDQRDLFARQDHVTHATILAPGEVDRSLLNHVPPEAWALAQGDEQKALPAMAKSPVLAGAGELPARHHPNTHPPPLGDKPALLAIPHASVSPVLPSPT